MASCGSKRLVHRRPMRTAPASAAAVVPAAVPEKSLNAAPAPPAAAAATKEGRRVPSRLVAIAVGRPEPRAEQMRPQASSGSTGRELPLTDAARLEAAAAAAASAASRCGLPGAGPRLRRRRALCKPTAESLSRADTGGPPSTAPAAGDASRLERTSPGRLDDTAAGNGDAVGDALAAGLAPPIVVAACGMPHWSKKAAPTAAVTAAAGRPNAALASTCENGTAALPWARLPTWRPSALTAATVQSRAADRMAMGPP